MKNVIVLLLLCTSFLTKAATNITTAVVSGHWTAAGAPYLIFNNIQVISSDSLVIDPGVKIEFQGNYSFIANGVIRAVGTISQPINFCVSDTTGWCDPTILAGGWAGMKISAAQSSFEFCNIQDIKGVQGDTTYGLTVLGSVVFKKCNFFHNTDRSMVITGSTGTGGSVLMDFFGNVELSGCNIHDNFSDLEIMVYWSNGLNVHDCNIYNNYSGKTPNEGHIIFSRVADSNHFLNNVFCNNYTGASCIEMYPGINLIKGNKIYGNYCTNDAILVCRDGNSIIDGNYICNNTDDGASCGINNGGGAIHIYNDNAGDTALNIIRNNIIANNYTFFRGAGIYVFQCNVLICNNQFINNKSHGDGAAIYCWGSEFGLSTTSIFIKNNVFFGNRTDSASSDRGDIFLGAAADMNYAYDHNWLEGPNFVRLTCYAGGTVTYNLISDYTTNINGTDPKLIAPTTTCGTSESALSANFGLLPTSECVNEGDVFGIDPGAGDYSGNTRVFGSSIDIGAFEYGSFPLGVVPFKSNAAKLMHIFPNPATGTINVVTQSACGKISITDISGRVVMETAVTSNNTSINIQDLKPGIYFAKWGGVFEDTATVQFIVN